MTDQLRDKVIRLAYNKPELRDHLLPLVVSGKTAQRQKTSVDYPALEQEIRDLENYDVVEGDHLIIEYVVDADAFQFEPVGTFVSSPTKGQNFPTFFYLKPGVDFDGLDEVLAVLDDHEIPHIETPHWNNPIWNPYRDMADRLREIDVGPAVYMEYWPDLGQIGVADDGDTYPIVIDITNIDGVKITTHDGNTIVNTDYMLTESHYDQIASKMQKASKAFHDLRPQVGRNLRWDPQENLERFFEDRFVQIMSRARISDMFQNLYFEDMDNSSIKIKGRLSGDILANDTEMQTNEQRNDAQRLLETDILSAMSEVIPDELSEFIVSAETLLGDKNYFYVDIEYETWGEDNVQLLKDLIQRAF